MDIQRIKRLTATINGYNTLTATQSGSTSRQTTAYAANDVVYLAPRLQAHKTAGTVLRRGELSHCAVSKPRLYPRKRRAFTGTGPFTVSVPMTFYTLAGGVGTGTDCRVHIGRQQDRHERCFQRSRHELEVSPGTAPRWRERPQRM